MSDLQISLLGVGVLLVAGVYLFNLWQERSFRRKTEAAFAREHDDVLMRSGVQEHRTPAERAEPGLAPVAQPAPSAPAAGAATGGVDPVIDFTIEVVSRAAIDGADLHEELLALSATWGKPVLLAGYDDAGGVWVDAGTGNAGSFQRLRFAVQLANRAGYITRSQLAAFREAVTQWNARQNAKIACPDIAEEHQRAEQLDRFCSEVDVAIGVNIVSKAETPFPGAQIRSLAEAAGFQLDPDGVFHYRGESKDTLFTLDNHEPMPFVPEQMQTLLTRGVTLLLDVPRVADAPAALETMLQTGAALAAGLEGVLVDDNRSPLSDAAMDKIRAQLRAITDKMQAGQIDAGSRRALRLFS
jgi:FtsZ-interacting cell division protein ZipA